MLFYRQIGLTALIALGGALAAIPASADTAAVATGSSGNGSSSSVAIANAPIGSTVVVNGKPCKVVAADKPSETGKGRMSGLSGTATASAGGGGSSVSINPGAGTGSVVVGSSSSDGKASANCVIVKPQSGAER